MAFLLSLTFFYAIFHVILSVKLYKVLVKIEYFLDHKDDIPETIWIDGTQNNNDDQGKV